MSKPGRATAFSEKQRKSSTRASGRMRFLLADTSQPRTPAACARQLQLSGCLSYLGIPTKRCASLSRRASHLQN